MSLIMLISTIQYPGGKALLAHVLSEQTGTRTHLRSRRHQGHHPQERSLPSPGCPDLTAVDGVCWSCHLLWQTVTHASLNNKIHVSLNTKIHVSLNTTTRFSVNTYSCFNEHNGAYFIEHEDICLIEH